MQTLKINLNTIDKVKEFVTIASKFEESMDIVKDRYVVDAKSIMGIFSMDLSKDLTLHIYSEKKEIAQAFAKFFA